MDVKDFLREVEQVRKRMYRDSVGVPTIGVGHVLTRSELSSGKTDVGGWQWKPGLTDEQIDRILDADLRRAEECVLQFVKVPLTDCQHAALVSFVFNVGTTAFIRSTLLRKLNEGDYDAVPGQLRRWVYAGGKVSRGLKKRREREVALWGSC